ncbi:hypothetical protein DP62_5938 [Burkholderia pseudomallei]|nr:hypothetical protein DP62_5938 [Burkholderia pseudomallei]
MNSPKKMEPGMLKIAKQAYMSEFQLATVPRIKA